jgi:hypothetical protein
MSTELQTCILTSERPLDGSLRDITSQLPRVNLALQSRPCKTPTTRMNAGFLG